MTVTAASLKARHVAFAATADATVEAAIAEAERCTNRDRWGSKADDGVTYLAAHILAVDALAAQSANAKGPITSESIGPLSWAYQAPQQTSAADTQLSSTTYGQSYMRLRASLYLSRAI